MSFQAGIYNALLTDPLLDIFLPPQILPNTQTAVQPIFYARIPAGVKIPFMSFWTIGGPPPDWTFEPDYVETIEFQVSMWSESDVTTFGMAYRVDAILTAKPIIFDNARNMIILRTSPLDNLILEPEADENDQDVWQNALMFQARLIRALGI